MRQLLEAGISQPFSYCMGLDRRTSCTMIVRTVGTIERNEKLSGLPDLPPSCGTRQATGVVRDNTPHGTPIMARATEVLAAIEALKQRPEIDPKRIGLWGISQGGWVAPMAAVRSKDVAFLILVSSPGGDAVSQLEYQAVNALRASDVGETELRSAAATLRRAFAIMRAGGSSQEFAAAVEPLQKYPVLRELGITVGTPEGYRAWQSTTDFVYRPDTALRELKQPTLAIFGDHDVLVDWRESVAIYRESFKRANNHDLTIKIFKGADHNIYGIGRTKSVDGYPDTMTSWLRARGFAQSSVEGR